MALNNFSFLSFLLGNFLFWRVTRVKRPKFKVTVVMRLLRAQTSRKERTFSFKILTSQQTGPSVHFAPLLFVWLVRRTNCFACVCPYQVNLMMTQLFFFNSFARLLSQLFCCYSAHCANRLRTRIHKQFRLYHNAFGPWWCNWLKLLFGGKDSRCDCAVGNPDVSSPIVTNNWVLNYFALAYREIGSSYMFGLPQKHVLLVCKWVRSVFFSTQWKKLVFVAYHWAKLQFQIEKGKKKKWLIYTWLYPAFFV